MGGMTADKGAKLEQWGSENRADQIWQLSTNSDGTYSINLFGNPDMCMDVYGVSKEDGAWVTQYTCHGGPNQKWRLVPVPEQVSEN